MPLPDSVHLSPAVAASVDRLGWGGDRPLLWEAAPTAARGHNLVVVAPPAPVYGVPLLAGVLSRLASGERRAILLTPAATLKEWAAVVQEVARGAGLRIEVALGPARAARRLRAGEVDLLLADPGTALALHRRSALGPETLATVVLAWPESWEGEALTEIMADVPRDTQRIILTGSAQASAEVIERYARRALTIGAAAAGTPPPAPAGPVRVVSVAWEKRAPALADLVELLDPASLVVWTVDRARHGEIERAVGAGAPGVVVTTGDAPRATLIVAFDPPTPERLAQLLAAGEVVLLAPPGTERHIERIAAPRRPLRLPGLPDTVASAAAGRRATIVHTIEGGRPDAALAALGPLFERYDAVAVAAALYDLWSASPAAAAPPAPEPPATSRIFVGIGKKDSATVNDLVAVLTKELRVERTKVGRVELRDAYMLVEVPAQEAERIASALNGATIRRKRVTARVDRGRARPARPSRPVPRRP